jgi:hypothetical protein
MLMDTTTTLGRDTLQAMTAWAEIRGRNESSVDNNSVLWDDVSDVETVFVFDLPIRTSAITDLNEDGYALLRPIIIQFENEEGGVIASFRDANISIGGTDEQDAFQSLFADILDTFDDLREDEESLGPDARRQLQILRTYIAKT